MKSVRHLLTTTLVTVLLAPGLSPAKDEPIKGQEPPPIEAAEDEDGPFEEIGLPPLFTDDPTGVQGAQCVERPHAVTNTMPDVTGWAVGRVVPDCASGYACPDGFLPFGSDRCLHPTTGYLISGWLEYEIPCSGPGCDMAVGLRIRNTNSGCSGTGCDTPAPQPRSSGVPWPVASP